MKTRLVLAIAAAFVLLGLSACASHPAKPEPVPAEVVTPAKPMTKFDFAKDLVAQIREAGNLTPLIPHLRAESSFIKERKREFEEILEHYWNATDEEKFEMTELTKAATGIEAFHSVAWQEMVCAALLYQWSEEFADFPNVLKNLGPLVAGRESTVIGQRFAVGERKSGQFNLSIFKDEGTGEFYVGNVSAVGWPVAQE